MVFASPQLKGCDTFTRKRPGKFRVAYGLLPRLNVNTARMAIFAGPGRPMALSNRALPARLEPGELLVEIQLATICGSDVHTLDGRRLEPTPSVLGHEAVGRVVAVGSGRESFPLGGRVTWTLADSCGTCRPCQDWGIPQKCSQLFKYGHAPLDDGPGLNGCYATHLVLRPGTTVISVPDTISDAVIAPANCALATMVCATEFLPVPCRTAVIQGAGLLGLYGCALLRTRGVERVFVVDTIESRLHRVPDFGGEPVLTSMRGIVPPRQVDAVFEVAGTSSVVAEGVECLRPGGFSGFIGMVHPGTLLPVTGEAIVRKCLTIRGFHNYAPRHLEGAVSFLERHIGDYPWECLVSPPRSLSAIDAAFDDARQMTWHRISIKP